MEGKGSVRMQHPNDISWPEESVKHQHGKYGQPLCDRCKRLGLDWSTIAADFDYVVHQAATEKACFNGVRDRDRQGMTLDDFMWLREAVETELDCHEVAALRFYTSHSFHAINLGLRDREAGPHALPAVATNINNGLKKLRGLDAEAPEATGTIVLYRGFMDTEIPEEFKLNGGSEYAPMSTSSDVAVATGYAVRGGQMNRALLMKIVTTNQLQRGADLTWLSCFPGEQEFLYPSLCFVQHTGRDQEVVSKKGFRLTVSEVTTTVP